MISKRGLVAAGALGLGTVLLAGTGAYACVIGDFSADSAVVCDTSGDTAQGLVTVHNDDTLTGASVTVLEGGQEVGKGHIDAAPGRNQKADLTIPVTWVSGGTYTVHIQSDKYNLNKDVPTTPQAPNSDCAKAVTPPPPPATPSTPPATPSSSPSTSASSTPSTDATATPAPSQSSPGTKLAETGGGSNSTTMIGIAAALVVVGGGALFMVRRKAGARG